MKQFLNIDENERRRILEMHENATKKHYLVEQSTIYKFSPESEAAREFLRRKFLIGPVHNQNWANMTQEEKDQTYVDARTQLNSMGMNALAQEAQRTGVSEDSIRALQQDLERVAGKHLQFVSDEQKKAFVDGKLGTNTAAAWLDYLIELGKKPKSDVPASETKPLVPGSSQEIKPTYKVGN